MGNGGGDSVSQSWFFDMEGRFVGAKLYDTEQGAYVMSTAKKSIPSDVQALSQQAARHLQSMLRAP